MAGGTFLTKHNSITIHAKDLNDYCKKYALEHHTTMTHLLVSSNVPSSTIPNSVRCYWLRHEGKGRKNSEYSKQNGMITFANGLCTGMIRKEYFEKICEIFEIKNPNDYILESEKEKEKPKAKAPSEYAIECHLKDIKELLKAQNLLLNKLVKMLE